MLSVLRLLYAAVVLLATPAAASAQPLNYPNHPIRLLIGFPPGGATDIIARIYAQRLSVRLGQPVVIENRPGSGGNLAADVTAKSAPDGYTLMHALDNVFMSNPHIYSHMPFDPLNDLTPVASLAINQLVLAVNPAVPANNLREFVELARRSNPPMFYASIGNGSQHHLAMELLKRHVGIDLTHVPYRGGGPAAIAVLSGEVSAMFGGGSLVPTVQSGKVRGLGSTGKTRNPATPDLPSIDEIYPGYEAAIWHGLFAPVGVPQPILERLRAELKIILEDPEFAQKLVTTGSGEPFITLPAEFAARIKRDSEKYGKLIRSLDVKLE